MSTPPVKERLQKILARAGYATSRRKAEDLLMEGVVTLNGKIAKVGDSAEFGKDSIKVRGKLLHTLAEPLYYAFYKPKEMIAALSDPENRPTIGPIINSQENQRLFPVERLDFMSDGLILVTNDGAFQERMQKKSQKVPRVYHVKVRGHVDAEKLKRLEKGAKLEDQFIKPKVVRQHEELNQKSIIEIVFLGVAGGFDLKAYFEFKGFLVERVTRVGIGHLNLGSMRPGELRALAPTQIEALFDQPELLFKKIEHETLQILEKGRDPRGLKPPPREFTGTGPKGKAAPLKLPTPNGSGGGKRPTSAKAGSAKPVARKGAGSRMPALFEGAKKSPAGKSARGAFSSGNERSRDERTSAPSSLPQGAASRFKVKLRSR